MSYALGVCLDIWEEGELQAVGYLGLDKKGRLRIVTGKGREARIPPARVANVGARKINPEGDLTAAGAELKAYELELRARATEIDLQAVWDILADDGGQYSLEELSELALGSREPAPRSVMLRCLVADAIYFVRKRMEFAPRSREELGETIERKRVDDERGRERAEFVGVARRWLATGAEGVWPAGSKRLFAALRDLAVHGLDAKLLKEGQVLLKELGIDGGGDPALTTFEALVKLGQFSRDENVLALRFNLQREFSPEVLAEAERVAAAGPILDPRRRDLTALDCYAIDDASTSEVDDAISLEAIGGGKWRLGIHIADPEPYIPHDGIIDQAARDRGTTHYLPEEQVLMLPAAISEGIGSLQAGEPRTVLSFLVEVDEAGTIGPFEVVEAVINLRYRLTYEQADALIALGGGAAELHEPVDQFKPPVVSAAARAALPVGLVERAAASFAQAARLARAMLERRAEAGALILKGPDLEVKVAKGEIRLRRLEPWTPSWVMVSEAMVLANRLAARVLRDAKVPAIYRRQPAPDKPLNLPRQYDPAAAAAARRLIKPTQLSVTPERHAGLGVEAYVQATSPLRRYQDLACHRQLKAALAGTPPPFDEKTLWGVVASTDEAEKGARQLERGNREYWLLRFLESLPAGTVLTATITRPEERRTLIELDDYPYFSMVQPRPGHSPGRKLKVVVDAVNPRAGRLVMREVGSE